MKPKIKTSAMLRLLKNSVLTVTLPLLASAAQAGAASTPSLNAVFGAAVFGTTPVAVVWLPGISLIKPALTTVVSFDSLIGLAIASPDESPVINAFFVDKVNWCNGAPGGNFVGCSILGSNVFAVESEYSSGPNGYLNIAHELGHAMGLEHIVGTSNLMNQGLGSTSLIDAQVTKILSNDKVQTVKDSNGVVISRFIEIRPIAVLSAVPEPETYAMLLAGLGVIATVAKRRKKSAA